MIGGGRFWDFLPLELDFTRLQLLDDLLTIGLSGRGPIRYFALETVVAQLPILEVRVTDDDGSLRPYVAAKLTALLMGLLAIGPIFVNLDLYWLYLLEFVVYASRSSLSDVDCAKIGGIH